MKSPFRPLPVVPYQVFVAIVLALFAQASEPPFRLADAPESVQGGWNYDRWLNEARSAADTLMMTAPDHYGKRNTPLWVATIDPDTGALVERKPPTWQTYWDAEDYVMTAQGCNAYRDLPMLSAFNHLSGVAEDDRYREAVSAYLSFWLAECPSPSTGLFPWGEHMSYNCVRDSIIATRHEMEWNLPDWEMLWRINPEAVRREIDAIYRINIWDKETFLYDRHANYYTGEFDPMPVRGTYIKHSGLFTHSFMFLYTKTGDRRHLDWARKMSGLYWQYRDSKTGLLPGYVHDGGGTTNCPWQLQLAYYLLEAAKLYPDPVVQHHGLDMVDTFLNYGFDKEKGAFAGELDSATGKVTVVSESPWTQNDNSSFYGAWACWDAYAATKQQRYLDAFTARLHTVANLALPDSLTPGAAGIWLKLYVAAYNETQDPFYLTCARRLATWCAEHLVKRGLILESASGYVYMNYNRPGELVDGWLALYEAEAKRRAHWLAPSAARPEDGTIAVMVRPGDEVKSVNVDWRWQDGVTGSAKCTEGMLSIPIPEHVAQGPMTLTFKDAATGATLDRGTVLVASSPDGPRITMGETPKWVAAGNALTVIATITDTFGVRDPLCNYTLPGGTQGRAGDPVIAAGKNDYSFSIPIPQEMKAGPITFEVTASNTSAWPVEAKSERVSAMVAPVAKIVLNGAAGAPVSGTGKTATSTFTISVSPNHDIVASTVNIADVRTFPYENRRGLPEGTLASCIEIAPDHALSASGDVLKVVYTFAPEEASTLLPSSLHLYRQDGAAWSLVEGTQVDANTHTVAFDVHARGIYMLGGTPRLAWRKTFNGALLSSPALARIDMNGGKAIILDTSAPDGLLYALSPQGGVLWTYDAGGAQPFPAVADLDGDGIDEIAIGGPQLTVIGHDGAIRWQADMKTCTAPAIGDIDGDGTPEIAAATVDGSIAAFTRDGKRLWRVDGVGDKLQVPVLSRQGSGDALSVVVNARDHVLAFGGDGKPQWDTPIRGEGRYAPAVVDLDGDGAEDLVVSSRTDTEGTLTAISAAGKVLWTAPVSREPDWCPIVAPLDENGQIRIVAQDADVHKLLVLDAQGKTIRTIPTTGRALQTPVPLDLNGDAKPDLLLDNDLSYRMWAIANDGTPLWSYTPHSLTMPGAKIKGGGSLLVADIDDDGMLDVIGGDDETWLNVVRTETTCSAGAVVSGQFHGNARHTGNYMPAK